MNIVSEDVYNKSKKRYEKEIPESMGKNYCGGSDSNVSLGEDAEDGEMARLRERIKNNDDLEGLL